MPKMRRRVVCGLSETIATLPPQSALTSVDLPTFGRPAIAANPDFGEGYFYLAKLLLDQGRQLNEAVTLARKGLQVAPRSAYAPLGHYVLADLYSRMGHPADAAAEAQRGRALEKKSSGT